MLPPPRFLPSPPQAILTIMTISTAQLGTPCGTTLLRHEARIVLPYQANPYSSLVPRRLADPTVCHAQLCHANQFVFAFAGQRTDVVGGVETDVPSVVRRIVGLSMAGACAQGEEQEAKMEAAAKAAFAEAAADELATVVAAATGIEKPT